MNFRFRIPRKSLQIRYQIDWLSKTLKTGIEKIKTNFVKNHRVLKSENAGNSSYVCQKFKFEFQIRNTSRRYPFWIEIIRLLIQSVDRIRPNHGDLEIHLNHHRKSGFQKSDFYTGFSWTTVLMIQYLNDQKWPKWP